MYKVSGELTVILITIWWLKIQGNIAASVQAVQKFDAARFNLRKLNELEVRKQYQIKNSDNFAALDNLIDDEDINSAWENIKQNSLGLYELKQHKPWFDEEFL